MEPKVPSRVAEITLFPSSDLIKKLSAARHGAIPSSRDSSQEVKNQGTFCKSEGFLIATSKSDIQFPRREKTLNIYFKMKNLIVNPPISKAFF